MRLLREVVKFFKPLILAPILAAALTSAAVAAAPAKDAGKRVALVIGNSVYKTLPSLPNPSNDVPQVGAALRAAGFDVTIGVDVDRIALEQTVRRFLRSAQGAEAGLISYSGHGIQVAGQNFLVPVDATLETPYDVETQTMPLDLIFNHLRQTSRVQLIFLDACRNNPFNAQKYRMAETLQPVGATRGLARIDSNLGSLVEALDVIQAMTSGHSGSLSTVHANTPYDALNRLETLALMSDLDMPLRPLRSQIASAVDLVLQIARFKRTGRRRVVEISEVKGLNEDGQYIVESLYRLEGDGHSNSDGALLWTGAVPSFAADIGEELPEIAAAAPEWFAARRGWRRERSLKT